MKSLPDVSTIPRSLRQLDDKRVKNIQNLSNSVVIDGLHGEQFRLITLDFDGSVLSTRGHAQGSTIGFNESNAAADFMLKYFKHIKLHLPGVILESRMYGAFFNKEIIPLMASKQMIETCESWSAIDKNWSYFESQWKPRSWNDE